MPNTAPGAPAGSTVVVSVGGTTNLNGPQFGNRPAYTPKWKWSVGGQYAFDLGGSGNETHAHLAADGRITIMFCAFDRTALILRIYGRGRAVLPQDADWGALAAQFTLLPGTRQIFDIAVDSVQTSCGWGVPVMELERERPTLVKYHAQSDPEKWAEKMATRTSSIDELPTRATDRFIAGDASAILHD